MGIRIEYKIVDTGIKIHPAITDAWHFFKSLQLFVYVAAIVIHFPDFGYGWWIYIVYWLVLGTLGNKIFLLFYKLIWPKIKK